MSTVLKNLVNTGSLAPATPTPIAHGLRDAEGNPITPDQTYSSNIDLVVVSADDTHITVRNDGLAPASATVLVERWHSIDRAFPGGVELGGLPFFGTQGGGGGGIGGTLEDAYNYGGAGAGRNVKVNQAGLTPVTLYYADAELVSPQADFDNNLTILYGNAANNGIGIQAMVGASGWAIEIDAAQSGRGVQVSGVSNAFEHLSDEGSVVSGSAFGGRAYINVQPRSSGSPQGSLNLEAVHSVWAELTWTHTTPFKINANAGELRLEAATGITINNNVVPTVDGGSHLGSPSARIRTLHTYSLGTAYETHASALTATSSSRLLVFTGSSSNTLTLPSAADAEYEYIVSFAAGASITVTPDGGDTVGTVVATGPAIYILSSDGVSHWNTIQLN